VPHPFHVPCEKGGIPQLPTGPISRKAPITDFGPAAILGLCFGFLWGIGCSLAILYAIYLGGYRKAVEDSLAPAKSKRFRDALKKIDQRKAQAAAAAAAHPPGGREPK
jgi:hypothetical protein